LLESLKSVQRQIVKVVELDAFQRMNLFVQGNDHKRVKRERGYCIDVPCSLTGTGIKTGFSVFTSRLCNGFCDAVLE
jgi:hypothetical protein